MSESFGKSHRQTVKDVNAGNVAPEASTAPKQLRGIGAVRGKRQDLVVDAPDDKGALVDALITTATKLGDNYNEEWQRKEAIKGYNLAGTEKGREEVNARSKSLHTKIFGRGAGLRAAQERIVKDDTDQAAAALQLFLEKDGGRLDRPEWEAHVAGVLSEKLAPHTDEGIKDQITQRFGENLTAISREREKKHDEFIQFENRQTFMDSIDSQSTRAQADIDDGDPSRVADAKQRLSEALEQPKDMDFDPWKESVVAAISNQLDNGRTALFDIATAEGFYDMLDEQDQHKLKIAKQEYDAQNDEDLIVQRAAIGQLAATSGLTPELLASADALRDSNYAAYELLDYDAVIETAFERTLEIEAEAVERDHFRATVAAGVPDSTMDEFELQRASEDHLDDVASRGVREEMRAAYAADGKPMPAGLEITPQQKSRWLLDNTAKWANSWGKSGIVTDRVKAMGKMVIANIGRIDMTEEGAETLRGDLEKLMVLKGEKPELFAKHFSAEDATRIQNYYSEMIIDGQDPFAVVQRQRDIEQRRAQGLTFPPQGEERVAGHVEEIMDDFINEKGEKYLGFFNKDPDSKKEIMLHAKKYFEAEYERTGDSKSARHYAMQRLNQGSTVIGNKFVLGGARLDTNSFGGSFDRYLQGINDSEVDRARLVLEYGLGDDFDLRDDANRYTINPDGSGATIWVTSTVNDREVEMPIPIAVPRTAEDIKPTTTEQIAAATGSALSTISAEGRAWMDTKQQGETVTRREAQAAQNDPEHLANLKAQQKAREEDYRRRQNARQRNKKSTRRESTGTGASTRSSRR